MIAVVLIISNRKLKFTMIWSHQTEVCSAPYLHKNELINVHHTMFVIFMDKHSPTPAFGAGEKAKHKYQMTSNKKTRTHLRTTYQNTILLWRYPLTPLVPSDPHMGRTAQLTSRRCILNTYSTNIRTEYFKRAA
jgi:hypothetical protein